MRLLLALAALALLAPALAAQPLQAELLFSRAGYPFALQGWNTPVLLDATNVGEVPVWNASLEERVPLAAPPLPHPTWTGVWAVPPLRGVELDPLRQELVLTWGLGPLRPGDTFHAQYEWVAVLPGRWNFTSTLRYEDPLGPGQQALVSPLKIVGLVPPLPPELPPPG